MYKSSIRINTTFLYTVSFVFQFMIGGLTGLTLGALATDVHVHDTYYVVAHFHYIVFGGMGFAFFAAIHYWFPKMFGRMYNEKIGKIGWAIVFSGFTLLYFPMFVLGLQGMPRRYFDYLPEYSGGHFISSIGGLVLIIGILIMVFNLIRSARKGELAPANPWDGRTLEWTIASPPPLENFDNDVVVTEHPYDYK